MIEERRVLTGAGILSEVAAPQSGEAERTRVAQMDDALETLVRQHSRLVYRIAYAVLRRHHEAEDATQETFMRLLRYGSKIQEVDDPKSWLARIAWRVAVDRSKRCGQQQEIPLDNPERPVTEVASQEAAADEIFQGEQVTAVLDKLIAALPRKLREPLILSTIEEMSPREVAATLGINEAAVRSRIFRARQILREKLMQSVGTKQVEP
jgi:RNA polymerase sigma-70 factor, ECF subfamily